VAGVYTDNDVSAYSGKPRPAWLRLIEDVKAGTVDAIACWHVDRLTRSPAELEHVIELADHHSIDLATVTGDVDLGTPTGRMVARILGATARQEAEHKGERQKRQRRQAAEAGKPNGGGTRPYGFGADLVTVIEDEAEIIRECARRALALESLSSIARDLAARDVQTPKGKHWQPRTLRRLLASARISGRREHTPRRSGDNGTRPLLGEIVGDAIWPAIISPADSDRLRALLSDPDRQRSSPANGRSYLLSGILRCGKCGSGMSGRPRSGVPRYVCPNMPGGSSCGGTATNAARTDELVCDWVLDFLTTKTDLIERLRRHDLGADGVDDQVSASVRSDEVQLEELAGEWASGTITRGEWMKARGIIEGRLERNRSRLARVRLSAPLVGMEGTPDELRAEWEQKNTSERRAIVSALLQRVDVAPADPRRRWDPFRFAPVWRM